jgi:plastocyanin
MRAGLLVLGASLGFLVPLLGCNRLPLEVRAAEGAERVSAADEPKQAWGTIKGKVTWAEKDLPEVVKLNVDKDPEVCKKNGDVVSEEYIVDKKTKGVKNVFIWLMDAKDPLKGKLPINPALAKSKVATVVLDQPCCAFEPHVIAVRDDQTLEVKNSFSNPHNVHLLGGGMDMNKILSPGDTLPITDLKAAGTAVTVQCDIHRWMKGYIRIFNHPYYAVTGDDGTFEIKDAPAGEYRIAIWHEGMGWVVFDDPDAGKKGKLIKIKADGVTDLGTFPLTKSKD